MQAEREVEVTTALGGNELLFQRMTGHEELGRPFVYELELLSDNDSVAFEQVMGHPASVRLNLQGEDQVRYFHGYVTSFEQDGTVGNYHLYRATLRPWLWFLTRSADCRIFPDRVATVPEECPSEMTVPEIAMWLFREFGFSDFEDALEGEYSKREFCVQYRETAFDFVSRLLEEEGIYYFFKHEEDKHTLVLCDDYASHKKPAGEFAGCYEGYDEIPFYPPTDDVVREVESIHEWSLSKEIQTSLISLKDYDFERPRADLGAASRARHGHPIHAYEVYDFPGRYRAPLPVGEQYARTRVEAIAAGYERVRGAGDVRGCSAGHLFTLAEHPREDQNREYLLAQVVHTLESQAFESGETAKGPIYSCRFEGLNSQTPFRCLPATPCPRIEGPQTATVVGPPDEEKVWTDNYGRVKVQFHWDRVNQNDDLSSCWVRVSQNWAGQQWGGMFLPHIGQEVIVEFLDGDPDRPIITGRVYNASNLPPRALPDSRFRSIIRDDYGNQIVFDATPGEEHISISSPHHDSRLILGQSSKNVTTSDEWTRTIGDTKAERYGDMVGFHYGLKHLFQFGVSTSVFVGASASLWIGGSFDVTVGTKVGLALTSTLNLAWGNKFSAFKGNEYAWGAKSFTKSVDKNIILDANEVLQGVGGDGNETLFHGDSTKLVLEYGRGGEASWDHPWSKFAKYAALNAFGLATAAGLAAAADGGSATKLKTELHHQDQISARTQAEIDAMEQAYEAALVLYETTYGDREHSVRWQEAKVETVRQKTVYDQELMMAEGARDAAKATWEGLGDPTATPPTSPPQSGPEYDAYLAAQTEVDRYNAPNPSATPPVPAGGRYSELIEDPLAVEQTLKTAHEDIEKKKNDWEVAKAAGENPAMHDWGLTAVGGVAMLGGLVGLGIGTKLLAGKGTDPFDPDTDRASLSRITLDEDGVFIENFERASGPAPKGGAPPQGPVKCALHLHKNGNVDIWSPGEVGVFADKKMQFQTGGKMILQAKEIVLDTPKLSGKAKSALDPQTKPEVPLKFLQGGFDEHKIPKYTPPPGKSLFKKKA